MYAVVKNQNKEVGVIDLSVKLPKAIKDSAEWGFLEYMCEEDPFEQYVDAFKLHDEVDILWFFKVV